MSVDIATLGLEVRSDGVVVASERLKQLTKEGGQAESATNSLSSSFGNLTKYVQAAAAAIAAWKLSQYIADATLLAARVETLGVVMKTVGNNAGFTSTQMEVFEGKVKSMGITTEASRQALVRMGQANLDMTKASELARIAQDAAVIANTNSSDAFDRMITGLGTGQAIILHHMGLMVNFEAAYVNGAKALNKTTNELTEHEKAQIRTNELIKAAAGINGAYESAMSTAGKQVQSMKRYTEELKLAVGDVFLEAFTQLVWNVVDALKASSQWMKENKDTLRSVSDTFVTGFGAIKNICLFLASALDEVGIAAARMWQFLLIPAAISGNQWAKDQIEGAQQYVKMMDARIEANRATRAAIIAARETSGPAVDSHEAALLKGGAYNKAEQERIAAGNKARAAVEAEEARKLAEKRAEEALQLAEKQATYDKQLREAEENLKKAYADNDKIREEGLLKDRLAQLNYEKEMGLKNTREYLDAKYTAEVEAAQKEATLASKLASERYKDYSKVSKDPGADRTMQAQAEEKWQKALGESIKAEQKLNEVKAQHPRDVNKYEEEVKVFDLQMKVQNLQLTGEVKAAQAAANELKYADMKKKGYTAEQIALQKINDQLVIQNEEYQRQLAVRKNLDAMAAANAATTASMVGKNAEGGFDTVADQTANQLAIQKAAHEERLRMLQEELQAQVDMRAQGKTTDSEYFAALVQLQNKTSLEKQKNDMETAKIHKEGTKSQLAVTSQYTDLAGQLFSGLAGAMDQSSRSGFETAKAFNIGAAVMSTASGIMAQLAGPDGGTPMAWARSALVGVMGAIQIAKIASTSFGGGAGSASASIPAGAFGGSGGAASTTVGSKIGEPISTGNERFAINALQKLADSASNASLAIGSLSDSFKKTAQAFDKGGPGWNLINLSTGLMSGQIANKAPMVEKTRFWGSEGEGSGTSYMEQGGIELDPRINAALSALTNKAWRTAQEAAIGLGTSTTGSGPGSWQWRTLGNPEEDAKALQQWLNDQADIFAKTVKGLEEFAQPGERASIALERLSSALYSTNKALDLVGHTLLTGLAGGNIASKLQEAMGGADEFTSKMKDYFSSMYTDTEQTAMKAAAAQREINLEFQKMGIAVPKDTAQFNAFRDSLDLTTDAGAAMYAKLTELGPIFAQIAEGAKAAKDALDEYNKGLQENMINQLQKSADDFQKGATALQNAINSMVSIQTAALQTLQQIMTGTLGGGSPESKYTQLQDQYAAASDKDKIALAQQFLTASQAYQGPSAGYQQDLAKVEADLARIGKLPTTAELQLSVVQQQLEKLNTISNQLNVGNTDQETYLKSLVGENASINDMLAAFLKSNQEATASAAKAKQISELAAAAQSAQTKYDTIQAQAEKVYYQGQGMNAEAMRKAVVGITENPWGFTIDDVVKKLQIETGQIPYQVLDKVNDLYSKTIQPLYDTLYWAKKAAHDAGVPGYASGGYHAGGWRMVGERGPELEYTGPSRIFSNAQTNNMLNQLGNNAELIAELRELRKEVAELKGHAASGNRIATVGFLRLARSNEGQEKALDRVKRKATMAAIR